jgi:hypothetical protein
MKNFKLNPSLEGFVKEMMLGGELHWEPSNLTQMLS